MCGKAISQQLLVYLVTVLSWMRKLQIKEIEMIEFVFTWRLKQIENTNNRVDWEGADLTGLIKATIPFQLHITTKLCRSYPMVVYGKVLKTGRQTPFHVNVYVNKRTTYTFIDCNFSLFGLYES